MSSNATELAPSERLAVSRARLLAAWERGHPQRAEAPAAQRAASWLQAALPGGLASLLQHWWQRHPLRALGRVAREAAAPVARGALGPTAARHPRTLVALAAGAGALVVWARPWRWAPRAALSSLLFSALWPHGGPRHWLSARGLSRLLSSGVAASWIASLASASRPAAHEPDSRATPSAASMPPGA